MLLPRECLFKIEITVYHHSPGFLLVPLKLSMKLGDKLHLKNLLWFSEYLLLSCSLPEVGKNGCGDTDMQEAAAASAVLGMACKTSPLFQVMTEVL